MNLNILGIPGQRKYNDWRKTYLENWGQPLDDNREEQKDMSTINTDIFNRVKYYF